MFPLQKYQNKNVAIYGMGKTGISIFNILKKHKIKISCWDDNIKIRKKIKNLNFPINRFWNNKNLNLIDYIFISPGIDINKSKIKNYLKKNIKKVTTDIDLFFELNKDQFIISVTGTNGKSTTCKIIEKILKVGGRNVKVGGNIGSPVLSLSRSRKNIVFILEISSYQLEYSKLFRSNHAAILNISPDHLDRHKSMENYARIKSKIFFAQKSSDYSYINSSNKYSNFISKIFRYKKIPSKLIKVSKKNCNFLLNKINNISFHSQGNIENLAFAYEIAKTFKIKDAIIADAINQYKGLPHRQEIVFSNKKVICINDSKATSFEASLQSLSNYKKIYWIVGGLPKIGDKFNLGNVLKNIEKIYVIGNNTNFFIKKIGKKIPYKISYSLKNAIKNIFRDIEKNKKNNSTILLSPAAASYDQFENFEDRGNTFKVIVKKEVKKFFHV